MKRNQSNSGDAKDEKESLRRRTVSIAEARELCKTPNLRITWRPNVNLPDEEQFCIVYDE